MPQIDHAAPYHQLNGLAQKKKVKLSCNDDDMPRTGNQSTGYWTATVLYGGVSYDGTGSTKIAAKNHAAVKVLRDHGYT
ncbi:hypothetical protein BJ165DRAFT_1510532 [Panaeolus papilionaceus]|nr:hypothetical protein BJ165DRAFT_1510532 [Panaeolus papilionaceus]